MINCNNGITKCVVCGRRFVRYDNDGKPNVCSCSNDGFDDLDAGLYLRFARLPGGKSDERIKETFDLIDEIKTYKKN